MGDVFRKREISGWKPGGGGGAKGRGSACVAVGRASSRFYDCNGPVAVVAVVEININYSFVSDIYCFKFLALVLKIIAGRFIAERKS